MSFYNSDFKVKYNNIREDLLENSSKEYLEEDIHDICTNLYQHELIQVFYASSLIDDKIDSGIQKVYDELLSKSSQIIEIINHSKLHLFNDTSEDGLLTKEEKNNFEKNSSYFLLLMLFSENMFYLTHQCICQLIQKNTIELALLVNFETTLNEMLRSKF